MNRFSPRSNPAEPRGIRMDKCRRGWRWIGGLAAASSLLVNVPGLSAADLTWDITSGDGSTITDGTGTWTNLAGGWNNGSGNVNWSNTNPDNAIFGGGSSGTAGTVSIGTGGITAGSITFDAPAAGTYTIATGSSGKTLTVNSAVTANASATIQGAGKLFLGGDNNWSIATGKTLTIDSVIDDGTSTFGITKTGNGTLALTGQSTYGGLTTVSGGTLEYGINSVLGSGDVTISGGILDIKAYTDTVGAVTLTSGSIVGSGGTLTGTSFSVESGTISAKLAGGTSVNLTKTTSGTVALSAANTYSGLTTVSAGVLEYGVDNAINAGGVTVSGGTLDIKTFSDTVGAVTLTSGSITGSGGTLTGTSFSLESGTVSAILGGGTSVHVTKSTSGTVVLSGVNTYSGTTTVNDGTLQLSGSGKISTNATTVTAGILDLNSTTQTITTLSLGGGVAGTTAQAILGTGGVLNLGGTVTYVSTNNPLGATVSGGTLNLNATTRTFTVGNSLATDADLTISSVIADGSATSSLAKAGAGTLVLSGNNTYSGVTTIANSSVLVAAHNNALGSTAAGTTVTSSEALHLSGNITIGAEALTLNGTGVATDGALRNISGSNIYGGQITLGSAVRINADADTSLTLSSGSAIVGNFGLTFGGDGSIVVSDPFSPVTTNQTLNKDGSGTLTLAATSTYTGLTAVSAGKLILGHATDTIRGAVTLAGGTLNLGGNSDTVGAVSINAAAASGNTIENGNLTGTSYTVSNTTGNAIITANLLVNGSVGLSKTGAGTLTLAGANTYTGTTTVSAGTLALSGSGTLGNGSAVTLGGGTLNLGALSATAGAVSITTAAASGNTIENGSLTATSYAASNTTGNAIVTANLLANSSASLSKTGAGTLTLGGSNTYTGGTAVSAGTLVATRAAALPNHGSATVTVSGTSRLVVNAGAVSGEWSSSEIDSLLANSNLTFAAGTNFGIDTSSGNFTHSSSISKANMVLEKLGSNTLTLSGASSYLGATLVSTGVLRAGNDTALGTPAGGVTVTQGAALELYNNIAVGAEAVTLSGDGVSGGGALRNVSGSNSWAGAITIANVAGPHRINSDSGTLTISGAIGETGTLASKALYFGGGGDVTVNGIITGGGDMRIEKDGSGTLTLSGANATIVSTTLSGGTLRATTNASALAGSTTGTLSLGGGILELANDTGLNFGRNTTVTASTTIKSERLTGGTGVTHSLGTLSIGAQTLTLDKDATVTSGIAGLTFGNVTMSATGAMFTANQGTLLNFSGTVSGANTSFTMNGSGDSLIAGVVGTGSGTLTKDGSGTLTLSGGNTYTGLTIISQGTLKLGAAGDTTNTPLGTAAAGTTVSSGGVLDLNGFTLGTAEAVTLNGTGVSSSGALTNTSATAATYKGLITLASESRIHSAGGLLTLDVASGNAISSTNENLIFGGSGNIAVADPISLGTGTLTKENGGTVTLSATNTYTGATTITTGTLEVNGSIASGSTVGVGTAGTLSGTGTVNGNATLTGNGVINFGGGGTIGGTLGVTGGNWNGAGSVTGAVTSSSDTFTIGSGAILTANGGLAVTGGTIVAGSGTSKLTGSLSYTSSSASVFAGVIEGSGKTVTLNNSAAVLTLSGTNTYSGTTTIDAGTLVIDGNNGSATGSVLVNAGATLKGNGTIGGATTIDGTSGDGNKATHAPGASVGKQTITNDLSYGEHSIFEWELASNTTDGRGTTGFDAVDVTGTGSDLSINAAAVFKVVLGTDFNGGASFWLAQRSWAVFEVAGAKTDTFEVFKVYNASAPSSEVSYSSYGSFGYAYTGNTGYLSWTPVPELSNLLVGGLLGAGLLRRRRKPCSGGL